MEDVHAHPELPWDWFTLSQNPNVTIQDVLAHPDKPWALIGLCRNPRITLQELQRHTEVWVNSNTTWMGYNTLGNNPSLQIDDVLRNPNWRFHLRDSGWDWSALSYHRFGYDEAQHRQATRTSKFKEELVEKAWHPDRFLDWCMETEG
jgi:hypothetical protein